LTEILMQNDFAERHYKPESEMKAHLGKVSKLVRNLVNNLDAIVWAANPKNDSLNHFIVYVYEYLDGLSEISPVRILRDVPTGLPDCPLSAEQRHNLFLVIKEALNNVFKHSGATEVWFRLRLENSLLAISIEDNGKGFSPATTSELGNGLLNMEKRMKNIGGQIAVSSEPGKGTRLHLQIPIRKNGVR